jgi:hypothetical protein
MPKRPKPAVIPAPGEAPQNARKECYDRILWEIRQGFASYAEAHPERVGDVRWGDALECSMEGLAGVVSVMEEYDVEAPGTCEALREELRLCRLREADLRFRLEQRDLGNGDAEPGEDP